MIVREETRGQSRLVMVKNPSGKYNIIRLVGGNESMMVSDLRYDEAEDMWDYLLEVEDEYTK